MGAHGRRRSRRDRDRDRPAQLAGIGDPARLGALLVLAFVALAVVLAEYAEHAEYAEEYATFDSSDLEVGSGMVTVIFAAAATVVDASFVLLRQGGPPSGRTPCAAASVVRPR
ncbi:MAG TPA: hypothetical protein VE032_03145 [Actinomycetota bacterium]|nr:hypothetical protein [Actinomycetota bacterium]